MRGVGYEREERLEIKLSEASGVPYYRQIKDQIAHMIRVGELKPGERLPSVRDLASRCLVSLITVRRSYADLEAEKWIVKRQGQGTYVSENVEMISSEQKLEEGRLLFLKMVEQVKALGLSQDEIRDMIDECMQNSEDSHE